MKIRFPAENTSGVLFPDKIMISINFKHRKNIRFLLICLCLAAFAMANVYAKKPKESPRKERINTFVLTNSFEEDVDANEDMEEMADDLSQRREAARRVDLIPIPMVKLPRAVESVSWSQDNSVFAYSENKNITLRSARDYSITYTIISDVAVNKQDFAGVNAADGQSMQLVTFNEDNSVSIRRLPDPNPVIVRKLDEDYVISKYAFTRNGNYVAIGTENGTIELGQQMYYTQNILTQKLQGHSQKVYELAFSPNGAYLASASLDGTIKIWRTADRTQVSQLSQDYPPPQFIPICFTKDNIQVIAPKAKRLIEVRNFQGVVTSSIKTINDINSICLSSDGLYVVVLTNRNQFQFYSIATGEFSHYIPAWNGSPVTCYSFSNDGEYLLVGHSDGSIYILKVEEVTYLPDEVPENYRIVYTDGDQEEEIDTEKLQQELARRYSDDEEFIPDRIATGHNVELRGLGVYATNKYYQAGVKMGLGYINDRFLNFAYIGAMASPSVFFKTGKYPYVYSIEGTEISPPMLWQLDGTLIIGKEFNPWHSEDWRLYAEGFIGGSLKQLVSPALGSGNLNTSLVGGGDFGARYKGLGMYVEVGYDSVTKLCIGTGASYRFRIMRKARTPDLEKLKEEIEKSRNRDALKNLDARARGVAKSIKAKDKADAKAAKKSGR